MPSASPPCSSSRTFSNMSSTSLRLHNFAIAAVASTSQLVDGVATADHVSHTPTSRESSVRTSGPPSNLTTPRTTPDPVSENGDAAAHEAELPSACPPATDPRSQAAVEKPVKASHYSPADHCRDYVSMNDRHIDCPEARRLLDIVRRTDNMRKTQRQVFFHQDIVVSEATQTRQKFCQICKSANVEKTPKQKNGPKGVKLQQWEFKNFHELTRHLATHLCAAHTPFQCTECVHGAAQENALQNHIRAQHNGQRLPCLTPFINEDGETVECTLTFTDSAGLSRHRKKEHGGASRQKTREKRARTTTRTKKTVQFEASPVAEVVPSSTNTGENREDGHSVPNAQGTDLPESPLTADAAPALTQDEIADERPTKRPRLMESEAVQASSSRAVAQSALTGQNVLLPTSLSLPVADKFSPDDIRSWANSQYTWYPENNTPPPTFGGQSLGRQSAGSQCVFTFHMPSAIRASYRSGCMTAHQLPSTRLVEARFDPADED